METDDRRITVVADTRVAVKVCNEMRDFLREAIRERGLDPSEVDQLMLEDEALQLTEEIVSDAKRRAEDIVQRVVEEALDELDTILGFELYLAAKRKKEEFLQDGGVACFMPEPSPAQAPDRETGKELPLPPKKRVLYLVPRK